MRFSMPMLPYSFDLPDAWWTEAGMQGFNRDGALAFKCTETEATSVALRDIVHMGRSPAHPLTYAGFCQSRMLQVLSAIREATALPPVKVAAFPETDFPTIPHPYWLMDGMHRFFASIACGHTEIPAVIIYPTLPKGMNYVRSSGHLTTRPVE